MGQKGASGSKSHAKSGGSSGGRTGGGRKKPFSNKKKKQQLQQRRERKLANRSLNENCRATEKQSSEEKSEFAVVELGTVKNGCIGDTNHVKGRDPNRYKLKFNTIDSKEAIEERKRLSQLPLGDMDKSKLEVEPTMWLALQDHSSRVEGLSEIITTSESNVLPQSYIHLDFPKRPSWNYAMSKDAVEKQEENYFNEYLTDIHNGFPADRLSAFEHNLETWRQLWRVLEFSDVVFLVTDARHPTAHYPPHLYEFVVKDMGKPLMLILNKCDLVPQYVALAWRTYFKTHFPDICVCCTSTFDTASTGNPASRKKWKKKKKVADGTQALLAAWQSMRLPYSEEWQKKIKADEEKHAREEAVALAAASKYDKYERPLFSDRKRNIRKENKIDSNSAQVKEAPIEESHIDSDSVSCNLSNDDIFTIGMIGQPNVGKSTVLNALVSKHVVGTSSTPGHTKHYQTYFMTKHLRLCDCPGLVFPSLSPRALQIILGIFPIAQVREPYSAVGYLAERVDLVGLLSLEKYHPEIVNDEFDTIAECSKWSAWSICEAWAYKRGFLTNKAGRPDVYRAANAILRHAVEGRIEFFFRPQGVKCSRGSPPIPHKAKVVSSSKRGETDVLFVDNSCDPACKVDFSALEKISDENE
eukprot:UC4_evm7s1315